MIEDKKIIYELPTSWVWTRLGQIVFDIQTVNPKESREGGFIYLDIASIDNTQMKITNPKKYFGKNAPSRARQLVIKGDILFSTVRTYLKNIAMVNEVYDEQIASTGFCVIRPFNSINKKLIFYFVQSDFFLNPLTGIQRGTSYPAVRNSDVFAQFIPVPPLPEQCRIVAKIEELFTRLDAGVEPLKKVKAQLKRYRQAVLKYAFEGKLTEEWRKANKDKIEPASVLLERIKEETPSRGAKRRDKDRSDIAAHSARNGNIPELPEGWVHGKLQYLIYIAGRIGWRGLKAEEYTNVGPMFLSVYNLNKGDYVDFSEVNHISFKRYEESPEIQLKSDDILLVKDGAGIGKVGIVKGLKTKATVNSSLLVIRSGKFFIPEFLFYFLKGPNMQRVVKERITGSATPHLFQRDIKKFELLIPSPSEQHQIVAEIERRFSVAQETEKVVEQSLKQAERLRQSILKRAFEGKLVPQDASDEPAEKLLGRIKAERRAEKKTRKSRKREDNARQMKFI